MALDSMGKTAEAIDAYKKSLHINPSFDIAWYNMASAQAALKDKDGALDSLRHAIDLNPQMRDWAKTNPDFAPFLNDPDFLTILGR